MALAVLVAVFAPAARAQSQGPSTSGGSLPYIASGQSEEEVQKRKRARLEAEEKARQAAEADRARQEAAQIPPTPTPEPAPTAAVTPPAATPAPATTASTPAAAPTSGDAIKPKATKSRQTAQPRDLPPGVSPTVVGSTSAPEPRVLPPQRSNTAAAPFPPQPQAGAVVVRRPMFFGLFGPEVGVTERVVVLPPANVGSNRPPAPPAAGTARVAARKSGSNCHYHAYPTGGMGFAHRDIQCHWHNNPNDPSLRYVD